VNGVRLYYEEHGAGAPILCIHGGGGSAISWGRAVEVLARRGRVIVYDRRGCTRSERPPTYDRTSVAEHTDDAAALLDATAAAPAIVIGRSYGGTVAIDLAVRYADRVRALVLLEPGAPRALAPTAAAWIDALGRRMAEVAATAGIDAVGEAFITEALGQDGWDSLTVDQRSMFTHNGPAILAELGGEWWPRSGAVALAAVAQPALLVSASASLPHFHESPTALAGALPNARTALVGGNHLIDPGGAVVLAFIDQVLANH
jgi:pimeloyl-ACP methyl ester carboxylesterase